VSGLVRRAGLRHHLRHPGQAGLALLGVAMGVAVVVSMDLAMASAEASFRASARTLAGRATHRIVGGSAGLPDTLFARVRVEAGLRSSAPVVEGWGTTPSAPGRALRILGIDPLSEGPIRPGTTGFVGGAGRSAVPALLGGEARVLLSRETARELGVAGGDSLTLAVEGRRSVVRVAGLLSPGDERARRGLRNVLVADLSLAQALLGRTGGLSRIDLVLPEGPEGEAALERVREILPPGVRVEAAGAREGELAEMIRSFDLNLEALSLLALLFGFFLIYNTVTFSVVLRRELLGRLRALGVTRRGIARQILGEAAVLGVAGSLLGLLLGTAMGRGLLRLVTRTINDLYFTLSVDEMRLAPEALLKGVVLGVGATLVAALPGAVEAARASPRRTLLRSGAEDRARTLARRSGWAGAGLLGVGGALAALPTKSVSVAFAALTALVLGVALLTPRVAMALVTGAAAPARALLGVPGAMAVRGVSASLSRTGPALVALVVAVSVTVGLGSMISSFRSTVEAWLGSTLQADVYVSLPGPGGVGPSGTLDPATVEAIGRVEGVVGTSAFRRAEVLGEEGRIELLAVELDPRSRDRYRFLEGDAASAVEALGAGEGVLVSEPFAFRRGVGMGDTLRFRTPGGLRALPVAGVFRDYGSDRGVAVLALQAYRRWWDDPGLSSLALFVEEGVDPDRVVRRVEEAAAGERPVVARSNRALRAASLVVFDRTFAVTGVLRVLAFVVAFIGILGALMALQLERAREVGVLRATGMTPGQVGGLVLAQTGLLGGVAGLLALPAGALLSWMLVHVVNRRSFGWSVDLAFGPELAFEAVALAVVAAVAAGVIPAWKMARSAPASALRSE